MAQRSTRGTGLTRRHLLALGGGGALAATPLAGCGWLSTGPNSGEDGADQQADVKQAPMLTERVEAGELPPLDQRLPRDPLVVEPVDRPGTYGGTWNTVVPGPTLADWMTRTVNYDALMRWDPGFSEAIPNIAASVEVDGDGRTYTFHLRENMYWSDGEPFTSADIVFAIEDAILNAEINPVAPRWLLADGAPPEVSGPDDHTVRFDWGSPNGLFLERLASTNGRQVTGHPRHYLEQFHADYNDDVDELVAAEGYDHWTDLFLAKTAERENADLPTLCPWVIMTALGDGNRAVTERNPYYFKTDPDGRQLPYIDEVVFEIIEDEEVTLLKATDGELDMHASVINTLPNKPVLANSRADGDYAFFDTTPAIMNGMMIGLNLSHEDEALRAVFTNKDFRIGLSHAINRPELIQTVAQGQGEPWQGAPRPESDFYDEEFAKQYTEFDPDLANEHLDRAGYTERNGQNLRLRPDGEPIRFSVEVAPFQDFWVNALELIREYWREVGIDMEVKPEDRSLFYERKEANLHDAAVWDGDGGLYDGVLDPRWYMAYSHESIYATAWADWFTSSGNEGQEPPEAMREEMELYQQIEGTADREERDRLFREVLRIAKEEFWAIGTFLPTQGYGIVKNNFHNVPDNIVWSWIYPSPGPTNTEQYFISDE